MSTKTSIFCANPSVNFTRTRVFTFSDTIKCILGLAGNSLNKELYDFFKNKRRKATVSAFVQQRAKITPYAFEYLFHKFNLLCSNAKSYKGYHLYAVDGTVLNIPTNPRDKETYLEQGFNQLHINALFDLQNRTYLDCFVQPRNMVNEPLACCNLIKRNVFSKSILIADRGYNSLNLIETINRTDNLFYLIRVKNDWITEVKQLPLSEFDTEISFELRTTQTNKDKELYKEGRAKWISGISKFGKYKKSTTWNYETPFKMTLRVVRLRLNNGTYETLVTSLGRFEFPLEEIRKLYHRRWGIETSFRELKYALGLVNLHSKKRAFIEQEIWSRILMYNYAEQIIASAVIENDKNRKWKYQVNFTMAFYICMDAFRNSNNSSPPDINNLISRYILPVRPNRNDERKIKAKRFSGFIYRVA